MVEVPAWDDSFPEPTRLRTEVEAAADALIAALCNLVPMSEIAGLYVKGSSVKSWDSPLDYVPSLSDVDVHVLYASSETHGRYFNSLDQAAGLSRSIETRYHRTVAEPMHITRVQLVVANDLYRQPDFIPSPAKTVRVRHGLPYPEAPVAAQDLERSRDTSRKRLRSEATGQRLGTLPGKVADEFGPHLRRQMRELSWRVAPTGPRVLEVLGVPFQTAWSSNRTKLCRLLVENGESDLASAYASFYLNGWRYYLTGDQNGEPARQAILAASRVLTRGWEIGGEETRANRETKS